MNAHLSQRRLLVFDCHEAWVYQLRLLDQPMNVVVGLKGRHTAGWDYRMRPVPPNARIVRLEEALAATEPYGCIIAHNLTDLLDLKHLVAPRFFVIHGTLEGIVLEERSATPMDQLRCATAKYLSLVGAHAIAISPLKARSWGSAVKTFRAPWMQPSIFRAAATSHAACVSEIIFTGGPALCSEIFTGRHLRVFRSESLATTTICPALERRTTGRS
jgi:hypothetical protein